MPVHLLGRPALTALTKTLNPESQRTPAIVGYEQITSPLIGSSSTGERCDLGRAAQFARRQHEIVQLQSRVEKIKLRQAELRSHSAALASENAKTPLYPSFSRVHQRDLRSYVKVQQSRPNSTTYRKSKMRRFMNRIGERRQFVDSLRARVHMLRSRWVLVALGSEAPTHRHDLTFASFVQADNVCEAHRR